MEATVKKTKDRTEAEREAIRRSRQEGFDNLPADMFENGREPLLSRGSISVPNEKTQKAN